MTYQTLALTSEISVAYTGPDIALGPMPALFYFALSAEESLGVDPFHQPAHFLSSYPLRVFSMTLPGHGENLPATEALKVWAEEISRGHDVISEFLSQVLFAMEWLIEKEIVIKDRLAVAGLSRGGFIAAHVAAKAPYISSILGFAPLTKLTFAKEFHDLHGQALAEALNLVHVIDPLIGRKLRFYIGNRDKRVGTSLCFHFIEALVNASFEKKIRSPHVELIISPSIGHQGHGTSPGIFIRGAKWIAKQLEVEVS